MCCGSGVEWVNVPGFVGLDFRNCLSRSHAVAGFDIPLGNGTTLHCGAECGHLHHICGFSSRVRCDAGNTRQSVVGMGKEQ